jgi:hypothetical protein
VIAIAITLMVVLTHLSVKVREYKPTPNPIEATRALSEAMKKLSDQADTMIGESYITDRPIDKDSIKDLWESPLTLDGVRDEEGDSIIYSRMLRIFLNGRPISDSPSSGWITPANINNKSSSIQLQEAIDREDYEEAARLRDLIDDKLK